MKGKNMAETSKKESRGKITQIISAVLDIKFPEGELPEINDAIRIPLKDETELVVEVAQHLGDDKVRCIALGPTARVVPYRYRSERRLWDVYLTYWASL